MPIYPPRRHSCVHGGGGEAERPRDDAACRVLLNPLPEADKVVSKEFHTYLRLAEKRSPGAFHAEV